MRLLTTVLILLVISPVLATNAPEWTGNYVNDYANILNNKELLESMLIDLERNSSVEFAVVTIQKLPADETIETYAYKIFNRWGIGKKQEDNGLLLLMVANGTRGSRMRIEVGYGMEGYITDSTAGRILDDALPYYENGDYSNAAYTIVSEIKNIVEKKYISNELSNYMLVYYYPYLISLIFPIVFFIVFGVLFAIFATRPKCPDCGSKKLESKDKYFICKNCGHRFKKKKRHVFFGTGFGGSGGGFGGGFGGGSSGGGGASR